jgi:hypothetical protein
MSLMLALTALTAVPADADVSVHADAYKFNESAEIGYTTGSGLQPGTVGGGGGYSYAPDALPGHQAFSLSAGISGSAIVSNASVNLFDGSIRSQSNVGGINGFEECGAGGSFADTITFNNSTGQPASVTFNWVVEGSMAASGTTGNQFCRAGYNSNFRVDGPGIIAIFSGNATLEGDPNSVNNGASATNSGWVTASTEPRSGGFGGANNSGTLVVPAGEFSVSFSGLINTGAKGDVPAGANFGSTAKFSIAVPQGVSFTSGSGTLSSGSRMVNIATRADVLGGDNVAIGGFIVTGNVPKKVIIRGIGPSLKAFGVPTAMDDPTLELKELTGNTTLATNDNWKDSQETEIQNSGLAPTNVAESAIIRTLSPGNYSATLRGKNDATGIGLVEVYDLDSAADSKLANISTRAFVEAGNNVLIGGIIGGGNGSQPKVLIRAIGPSLTPFGVPNALQNPVLELHDKNGATIATNDDWESDQKAAIEATGLQPSNPKESAILATLQPTNYTAIVKGANNTAGVGLVEVYHLQ